MNSLIGKHEVFRGGQNVGTVTVAEEGRMTAITCSCDMMTGGVMRLAAVSGGEFVSIGVVAPEAGRLRLKRSYTKSALDALRLDDNTSFYLILSGETLRELKTEADTPAPQSALDTEPEPESAPEPETTPEEIKSAPPEIVHEAEIPEIPELAKAPPPEMVHTEPNTHPPVLPRVESPKSEAARELGDWKPIRDPASLFSDGDIAAACKDANGALTMERGGFLMLAIPVDADEPFPMMPVFCFGTSETIAGVEYIVFKTKNGNLAV